MEGKKRQDVFAPNRREFIAGALATASLGFAFGGNGEAAAPAESPAFLRSALLHLSMNMWGEYAFPGETRYPGYKYVSDRLATQDAIWNATIDRMVRRKYNHAVVDVGDAVVFPSHPEIAIKGSWTADRLRDEVVRLKKLGIEAVPKLNFSAGHDGWLKQYGRMVSTRKYYQVVTDLIADTCEIFGNPRQFHLGLDEEETIHVSGKPLVQVRKGELWWHDAQFLFDEVGRRNAQPICFGMTALVENGQEVFLRRMPRSVIQNLCIYGSNFDVFGDAGKKPDFALRRLQSKCSGVETMAKAGYTILGGTSAWVMKPAGKPVPQGRDYPLNHRSAEAYLAFLRKTVPTEQLMGMVAMPWEPMTERRAYCWESGIDELADALDGTEA